MMPTTKSKIQMSPGPAARAHVELSLGHSTSYQRSLAAAPEQLMTPYRRLVALIFGKVLPSRYFKQNCGALDA